MHRPHRHFKLAMSTPCAINFLPAALPKAMCIYPRSAQRCVLWLCLNNLAQMEWGAAGHAFTVCSNIDMWAREWKDYPFDSPQSNAYSHFTEMVWKGVASIGCSWYMDCGWAESSIFFVCHYGPPGNMLGSFAENVGKFTGGA